MRKSVWVDVLVSLCGVKLWVLKTMVAVDIEIWIVVVLLHEVSVVQQVSIAVFWFDVDVLSVKSDNNYAIFIWYINLLVVNCLMPSFILLPAHRLYVAFSPTFLLTIDNPCVLLVTPALADIWVTIFTLWVPTELRLNCKRLAEIGKFLHAVLEFVIVLFVLIPDYLHLERG